MADERTPTSAVSLLDACVSNVPYALVDESIGNPVHGQIDQFNLTAANAGDPLECPKTTPSNCHEGDDGALRLQLRIILEQNKQVGLKNAGIVCVPCLAMALGFKQCSHLLFRNSRVCADWMGVAPGAPSGLVAVSNDAAPVSTDYSVYWHSQQDPYAVHCAPQSHHASTPTPCTPSVSPTGISSLSTMKNTYAAASVRVGDNNAHAERPTTGSQPSADVPFMAGGPQVDRHSPRFQQSPASHPASPQVQATSQATSSTAQLTVPSVNTPYVPYIESYNVNVPKWYVVIVGPCVGVFSNEPSPLMRTPDYLYFLCNTYDEAISHFWRAEARGEVKACARTVI
ncbi:hypothetical protein GSI_05022 [Ganoderma sinense ZZ0214-1]|uniref:Uncharacterized protein n=1 Tax=Ganoderma sinense ZZ0214-1 TaxID=1077348 RepID=A0A2G8SGK4_9APHY|nr:hypothetical protein GSI_05022 [Ganoderma sinense ZZ0214-1]